MYEEEQYDKELEKMFEKKCKQKKFYAENQEYLINYRKEFKKKKIENKNCDLTYTNYIEWKDKGLDDSFIYNAF